MTNRRRLMLLQAASGSFDPSADITWHSLFWAEGADFVAAAYADGATVTNWPNETANLDASTAVGSPLYRAAAWTAGNSKPSVEFGGSANIRTATFSSLPSYAAGVSWVVVAQCTDASATRSLVDTAGGNATINQIYQTTSDYRVGANGTQRTGGTSDVDPHLFVAFFDGSTGHERLDLDNTTIISGADAGSAQLNSARIGSNRSGSFGWIGNIALVGLYEGDITADGSWADFRSWITSHYGITLA